MKQTLESLLTQTRESHPQADLKLIERGYRLAAEIHQGQKRLSGQRLIDHLLAVAHLVAEIRLDETAVTAALLHESIRQGNLTGRWLAAKFDRQVANYVRILTKLSQTQLVPNSPQLAENLRKTFLLLAKDLPVALIRLADRVDNLRTVAALPAKKRVWAARQALNFYAPIAEI
ncbi:MAG: HD domain-containing protein, partial [Alphaproteobacteria bacterium]